MEKCLLYRSVCYDCIYEYILILGIYVMMVCDVKVKCVDECYGDLFVYIFKCEFVFYSGMFL